jgi:hypothetical protein
MYMGYAMVIYFFKATVAEGWLTQSLQSAVAFFVLFLMIAVLCEYVGRIIDEISHRPLYYVQAERNSSALWHMDEQKNVVIESRQEDGR